MVKVPKEIIWARAHNGAVETGHSRLFIVSVEAFPTFPTELAFVNFVDKFLRRLIPRITC